MEIKNTYHSIWKISYPIIFGLVAQNILNVIDTAFLGRVSDVALGAGAIGGLFYFALITIGMGFGIGAQIMIGRKNGEKNYAAIGPIVYHTFFFLSITALMLFAIFHYLAPFFLKSVISSPAIYKGSLEFFEYRIWGILFAFINITFSSFYIGVVKTRVLTFSTTLMAAINIILDYCLIFGHWGFPEMGIGGAALASVIAEVAVMLFFIIYTLQLKNKSYHLFKFIKLDFTLLKSISKLSMPVMLQYFMSFSGWFIFFIIVERISEEALAISNIIRSIYMVIMIPVWGLSTAVNTIVSNVIGQGRHEDVLPLIKKVVFISIISAIVMVQGNIFFPRLLISFYTNNPLLIEHALPVLNVVTIAMMVFSIAMVLFSSVSGSGNTKITLIFETYAISIYIITAYLLSEVFHQPIAIIWIVEIIYFLVVGISSYIYLKSKKWQAADL